MAEFVNQRIEDVINELEQMRRTSLYDDEEIREISKRRKELEYRLQRRMKQKEDYADYIAYELTLLEDIALRRKMAKMTEKKQDIEYAIAKRLNKVFKQFIYRFQDNVEVYFQYIKFCKSVGFDHAISGIIGQMLQIHGSKPKMWQLASLWESEQLQNYESARNFLLKGIHRHPEADFLYLELFKIELSLAMKAENIEEKEKFIKRADVVWRNGQKNVSVISYLFKLCDLAVTYDIASTLLNDIKQEIWELRQDKKEVWSYVAAKELLGYHWKQTEELVDDDNNFTKPLNYYIAVYEEALIKFSDAKLCTKYIHDLLGLQSVCTETQKINAVKHAWRFGHENGLLSNDMYIFGIHLLKLDDEISNEELSEIIDTAIRHNPQARNLWEEKLLLNKSDDKKMLVLLQAVNKNIKSKEDLMYLWNLVLEHVNSADTIKSLLMKSQNCEEAILLHIKPKLLKKLYEVSSLKAARELYEEFIRMPPTQVDLHQTMIEIEKSQQKPNVKMIRKCFECLVQHHGHINVSIWMDYLNFEKENRNIQAVPAVHRRAIATLKKDLVDEFIKAQTLVKLKL